MKRKIIVICDIVFRENQSWSWNTEKPREEKNSCTFELELRRFDDNIESTETRIVGDNVSIIPTSKAEEEDDEGVDADQPPVPPRISTRVSNKPSYLDDYILLADEEYKQLLMIINDETWDFT